MNKDLIINAAPTGVEIALLEDKKLWNCIAKKQMPPLPSAIYTWAK